MRLESCMEGGTVSWVGSRLRWARVWGGSACTRGVGEPESDGLVRDATHVAYRHLAGVAGVILGPKILQLQDLGLPLGSSGPLV